jgi:hypothetical protein
MTNDTGRSPPTTDRAEQRRFVLRRVTFRRRHERPNSERRIDARRQPATRLMFLPSRPSSRAAGLMH